jgi:hypothetical protein
VSRLLVAGTDSIIEDWRNAAAVCVDQMSRQIACRLWRAHPLSVRAGIVSIGSAVSETFSILFGLVERNQVSTWNETYKQRYIDLQLRADNRATEAPRASESDSRVSGADLVRDQRAPIDEADPFAHWLKSALRDRAQAAYSGRSLARADIGDGDSEDADDDVVDVDAYSKDKKMRAALFVDYIRIVDRQPPKVSSVCGVCVRVVIVTHTVRTAC